VSDLRSLARQRTTFSPAKRSHERSARKGLFIGHPFSEPLAPPFENRHRAGAGRMARSATILSTWTSQTTFMAFRKTSQVTTAQVDPEALFRDLRSRKVQGLMSQQADTLRSYLVARLDATNYYSWHDSERHAA